MQDHGRPAGPLGDLGAPDVYYQSLDGWYGHWAPTASDVAALPSKLAGMRGLILDLRGYPTPEGWDVLATVAPPSSLGPIMKELSIGPDARAVHDLETQRLALFSSAAQAYFGKVVVLVGPETQSQAEHWLFFMNGTRRATIVGGTTSGADGTITGVQLPGGFGLSFTGRIVRNPDGSAFHAHGIAPDVEAAPTIDDLRRGRDTVLLRGIGAM